jgi:hypothetical protein
LFFRGIEQEYCEASNLTPFVLFCEASNLTPFVLLFFCFLISKDMRKVMKQDNQLDDHGQPRNTAFNHKNNKTKAVLTLKGIIDGILADVALNDIEVIYLKAWCCNDTFDFNDGDFIGIKEQIEDILEDGMITSSEQKDMQQMLSDNSTWL